MMLQRPEKRCEGTFRLPSMEVGLSLSRQLNRLPRGTFFLRV